MRLACNKRISVILLIFLICATGIFLFIIYNKSDTAGDISFASANVEPFKIKVGEEQTTRVSIKSREDIARVSARIPFEGGEDKIELALISGTKRNGVWEGKWTAHNTLTKEYQTLISATDINGLSKEVSATWWDDTESQWLDGWSDRERVIVTENSGSTQTNYKTEVNVAYRSGMQSDFDDIRFTSADGTTILNHYLSSKTDNTTSKFYVTIPSLPASADTSIYYYFGNDSAASASNPAYAPSSGASLYTWAETSGTDFADGTFSNSIGFSSGTAAYVGLGPGTGEYAYEKPITVTNNTASTLTDYQVQLTIDTASLISAGKMQSDCDDMRFYESDRSTAISYFVDSGCNTSSTVVYLKTTLTGSSSKTVYVYYGNSSSTSASSGTNTFMLYDDLESGAVDTNKWEMETNIGTNTIRTDYKYAGTYSIGSSQPASTGLGITYYDQVHFMTKTALTSFPVGATIIWKGYIYRYSTTTWAGHFGGFGVGGTSTDPTSEISDVPTGAWYKYEWYITRTATDGWEFEGYRDGTYLETKTLTKTFTTLFTFGIQTRHNNASDNSIYVRADNVSIRQYVTNEPTCSIGTESMRSFSYASSGNYISSTLDVGAPSKLNSLDITTTAPTNTEIKFQLAANNDNSTWSYIGPDGTASTYYTADSTTFASSLQGKRFVRYKAYLQTSDTAATPQLNDITLSYISTAGIWTETTTTDFQDGTTANTTVSSDSIRLATGVGIQWGGTSWAIPTPDSGAANEYPAAAFADLDNDGDLDVMVGNVGGITYAYKNTGSSSSPVWTAEATWNTPDTGDYSMPALADLDGDGDYDLLVGEAVGACKAYKNTGSSSSPVWTAEATWNTPDVGTNSAPTFADLDNDGDKDLMIGETSGYTYGYKNTGSSSSPVWTAETTWNSPDIGVCASPALVDIDGDGDYDMEIGSELGPYYAYKNTGTASSPTWSRMTYWDAPQGLMYSNIAFADLDNDGDKDIARGGREMDPIGVYSNTPITIYGTSGNYTSPAGDYTSSTLDISTIAKFDSIFFHATTPTNTTAKFRIAVNNDNSTWNFVGPDNTGSTYYTASTDIPTVRLLGYRYMKYKMYLETTDVSVTSSVQDVSINYTKVWQQTTTADFSGGTLTNVIASSDKLTLNGTIPTDPTWTAHSSWNGPDIGTYAIPTLADLDSDGDKDLMIGTSGGASTAYKNTGSASSPTWTAQSSWNLPDIGKNAAPTFGDYLDGDGDLDVHIGDSSYGLYGYRNTGSASSPAWTSYSSYPMGTGYETPVMADLDNDGDLDMLYGDLNGITYAQKNTGTSSSPSWSSESTWNAPDVGDRSVPALADIDGDGDYDLFIGAADGITYAYKNTGSASSPTWTAQSSWNAPDVGTYAAPAFADLDGDGYKDLLIGAADGISYAYEDTRFATYSTSGNLISSAFDSNTSINLGSIYFNKTTPANTLVKFQLATNDNNSTWSFIGPDGTASTYYTTDIEPINTSLDQKRYVKYKAYLETSNTAVTPELLDFAIGYVAASGSSGTPPTVTFTSQTEARPNQSGSGSSGGAFMGF